LVVLSPGFQLGRDLYQSYCEHFASWGFIAVSQTYSPDVSGFTSSDHVGIAEDTNALVDALIAESANGLNVDGDNVALVGHSLGGKVSILASTLGTQAKAVVGLDPVDANEPSVTPELMPSLNADLLLLGETLDSTGFFQACAPADNNFEQYFAASPSGTVSLDIDGAGHMQFHDNPSCLACLACSNGTTAPAEEVLAISRYAATQFLLSRLQGYGGWSDRVGAGLLSGGSWSVSVAQSVR
jgi:pimeloyl-ACP methyl ester carboxylesterase